MARNYQKPPVREVVCEFRVPPELPWDMTVPGLLYEKLRELYPQKRQQLLLVPELFRQETALGQRIKQDMRLFFLNVPESRLIQIGDHVLAVHARPPYEGWEEFQPRILTALDALTGVAHAEQLSRIGLRYINFIEVPGTRIELQEYFSFRPFIGEGLPQNHGAFMLGCEFPFEKQASVCRATLTSAQPEKPDTAAFLFDLDFGTVPSSAVPHSEVPAWIMEAHRNVEGLFEGCLTDKLRVLFGEAR